MPDTPQAQSGLLLSVYVTQRLEKSGRQSNCCVRVLTTSPCARHMPPPVATHRLRMPLVLGLPRWHRLCGVVSALAQCAQVEQLSSSKSSLWVGMGRLRRQLGKRLGERCQMCGSWCSKLRWPWHAWPLWTSCWEPPLPACVPTRGWVLCCRSCCICWSLPRQSISAAAARGLRITQTHAASLPASVQCPMHRH